MTGFPTIAVVTALASLFGGAALAAAPPTSGTIAIDPGADGDDPVLPAPLLVRAAGDALSAKGLTVLDDPAHSAYVAELIFTRADVGTGSAKATAESATIEPGLAAGVGAGATIPLPSGNSRLVALQRSRLEIRIRKRGGGDIVWDGAAITVRRSGTREGAGEAVASDLSAAVLRSYPAAPEGDIGVP